MVSFLVAFCNIHKLLVCCLAQCRLLRLLYTLCICANITLDWTHWTDKTDWTGLAIGQSSNWPASHWWHQPALAAPQKQIPHCSSSAVSALSRSLSCMQATHAQPYWRCPSHQLQVLQVNWVNWGPDQQDMYTCCICCDLDQLPRIAVVCHRAGKILYAELVQGDPDRYWRSSARNCVGIAAAQSTAAWIRDLNHIVCSTGIIEDLRMQKHLNSLFNLAALVQNHLNSLRITRGV